MPFIHADAKARGEHGSIIVRARIDSKSCADPPMQSCKFGVPALDAAALAVAEASRFQAAVVAQGKPIDDAV